MYLTFNSYQDKISYKKVCFILNIYNYQTYIFFKKRYIFFSLIYIKCSD